MLFTIEKQENQVLIKEDGHNVYTIEKDDKEKYASFVLKNMYGSEVLNIYQIKKWWHITPALMRHEYTIYEEDRKIGELRIKRDGFVLMYHGVSYYIYGGKHAAKHTVIVFEREVQVAEFSIDEHSQVHFTNGVFGSMYAMLLFLFQEVIKENEFSEEAFLDHYRGMYLRSLDNVITE